MNLHKLCLVLLLAALFGNQAHAQGPIQYSAGYPKAPALGKQAIAIKGTITFVKGWTIKKIQFKYWQDGKKVQVYTVNATANYQWDADKCGNWVEAVEQVGLAKTYFNVLVEATMNDGTDDVVIATKGYRIQSN